MNQQRITQSAPVKQGGQLPPGTHSQMRLQQMEKERLRLKQQELLRQRPQVRKPVTVFVKSHKVNISRLLCVHAWRTEEESQVEERCQCLCCKLRLVWVSVHTVRSCGLFDQSLLPLHDAISSHKSWALSLSLPASHLLLCCPRKVVPVPEFTQGCVVSAETEMYGYEWQFCWLCLLHMGCLKFTVAGVTWQCTCHVVTTETTSAHTA